jgi:ATP/ADP translocase/HEAT repeat protein
LLNLLAQIRPGERRDTAAAFFVLFGIMAAHVLQETARDALFLARLPPARLAWVYLSVAVLSLTIWALQQRKRQDGSLLAGWMILSAVVTLAFWWLLERGGHWSLYALYTWSGVFATLVVVRFWTLLGDLFTVSQAKRLYALVGAGSLLGAAFGSGLARMLSEAFAPRHLLLASVGMLVPTAVLAQVLLRRPALALPVVHEIDRGWARPLRAIRDRPYLRRVAGIVLVSTLCLTLVDFLFKSIVARSVPANELAAFFATSYAVLNTLALGAQLFLVNSIVRWSGVDRVLAVLPALVVVGTTAFLAVGTLPVALILKGFDGVLRHSLHRTATEVLFVPLTGDLRARVKGIIDVLGQRGGQALASLCILAGTALGAGEAIMAGVLLLLALVWIRIASLLKKDYLDVFRQTLSQVALQHRIDFPAMDLGSLETLMAGLNSPNDNEVVAALELLAEQERARLIPALILYHPSPQVVTRALDILARAGRTDFAGILERLYEHADPEVRAAALRARAWVAAPSVELYQRFASDKAPVVRATALVGLVSYGASREAAVTLARLAKMGSSEERLAVARAIGYSPGAGYDEVLLQIATSPETDVKLETARVMREVRSGRFIPSLLEMLGQRALRREATATLVAIGPDAMDALDAQLGNQAYDYNVRRQIPRVLATFPPDVAAPVLVRHLRSASDGGLRYRILRALGRLRADHPGLDLDRGALQETLHSTLRGLFELIGWRATLLRARQADPRRHTDVQDLLVALLGHKEVLATERVFRLIGLLHAGEDLRSMYRGMRSADRQLRSSSMELLEHLLGPPLRDPVLALVDDVGDQEKLQRAGAFGPHGGLEYEALLAQLLERGGVGMRCLVVTHVGELRLRALRDRVAMLPSDLDGLVSRAVSRTLVLLDA